MVYYKLNSYFIRYNTNKYVIIDAPNILLATETFVDMYEVDPDEVTMTIKDIIATLEIVLYPEYEGSYIVDPNFSNQYVLCRDKVMLDNVTVHEIKVTEVKNPANGLTLSI